jgi:hypothetical protein
LSRLLLLAIPLLVIGIASGALRILARLPEVAPARRRTLQASWVILLLVGVPVWLVLSAILGLW